MRGPTGWHSGEAAGGTTGSGEGEGVRGIGMGGRWARGLETIGAQLTAQQSARQAPGRRRRVQSSRGGRV